MRILYTAHTYPPEVSGVAEVVAQLAERLAARGHDVHVATCRPGGTPQAEQVNGVDIRRFRVQGNRTLGMTGEVNAYRQFVYQGRWDLIVMHCAQIWTTDALLTDRRWQAHRMVIVAHGLSAWASPAYREYFDWLSEKIRDMGALIGLSPLCEEGRLSTHYGLPEPHYIPNGVDPDEWAGPTLGMRERWRIEKRAWLVNVSNHNPLKNHPLLLDILQGVKHSSPAVCDIIGRPHLAAKYKMGRFGVKGGCWYQCLARNWLNPSYRLRPNCTRQEKISAIREADLVLVSSTWEAYPLVVLESMAAGTPWVALDTGAIRGNAGGIVCSSPAEMLDATRRVLGDPAYRARLGREGRRQIMANHQWSTIASRHEHLYRQLAGQPIFKVG